MFRHYEKTFRILVPQISTVGKHYLSDSDTQKLLNGKVTLTEKMDGANTAIIRNKNDFRLQKRGSLVDTSEHYQFNFFKAWSQANYDKLMSIPQDTILYGELMICQHTIHYDSLPDYFLAFGLFDRKSNQYKHWNDLKKLCDDIGLATVPLLEKDTTVAKTELFDMVPNPSNYGHEQAEGLVVWNYNKQMRGKVVLRKFQESIDEDGHWSRKTITKNLLKAV